ncbi:MAG: hypothetical protein WAO98_01930, partial [Alphaproteobacteria bacterium]
ALMGDSPKDPTRLITTGTWGTTSFVVTVEKGASSKQIEAAQKPDGTPVSVVRTKVEFTSAGLDITVGEGKYPAPATAPAAFPIKYDVIPGVSATAKRPKLPKDASAQAKADVEAAANIGKLIFACVP